jgi:hypothetical protein
VWGLSRYAYVVGNPTSKTDPDGHCFPLCTALAGFAIGAALGAATSIASQAAAGHCCDVKAVVTEAAVGGVSGAITGVLGPAGGAVSTILIHAAVGAAVGAGGQLVTNAVEGKPLGDGVLFAGIVGGVTGGISGGIVARQIAKAAEVGREAAVLAREQYNGVLSRGLRSVSRRILQRVTDAENDTLGANPGLARQYLSPRDYLNGQRNPALARANYGKALENMVAARVRNSRVLSSKFRRVGNADNPDFVGRGIFSGINYDIFSNNARQIASHGARWYGPGLQSARYFRPGNFYLFP